MCAGFVYLLILNQDISKKKSAASYKININYMGLRTETKRFAVKVLSPMETYKPVKEKMPANILEVKSAWKGLELVIEDILDRFDVKRNKCIEFGTEFCYSTVVFSNFFKEVKGIDLFTGDPHAGFNEDHYEATKKSVAEYKNIQLIQSDYRDYIKKDNEQYDFAHVDIIHTYKETYECGLWAAKHSKCCIFHDTVSHPAVWRAVFKVAKETGKKAYNYPFYHGLGIVV